MLNENFAIPTKKVEKIKIAIFKIFSHSNFEAFWLVTDRFKFKYKIVCLVFSPQKSIFELKLFHFFEDSDPEILTTPNPDFCFPGQKFSSARFTATLLKTNKLNKLTIYANKINN